MVDKDNCDKKLSRFENKLGCFEGQILSIRIHKIHKGLCNIMNEEQAVNSAFLGDKKLLTHFHNGGPKHTYR